MLKLHRNLPEIYKTMAFSGYRCIYAILWTLFLYCEMCYTDCMAKKRRYPRKKSIVFTQKQKSILCIVLLILIFSVFLSVIIIKRNGKILDVAYYRLPVTVTDSLSSQIKKSYSGKIRFKVLPADTGLSQNKALRYDLLFTWNGVRADILAEKAVVLPSLLYAQIPSSERKLGIVNGKERMLPLLYDHYEVSFLKETAKKSGAVPEDWNTFMRYLHTDTSGTYVIPFFAAGADNRSLLAFVGALADALTGSDGYGHLTALVKDTASLDSVIDEPFGTLSDGKTAVNLRYVLDLIASWQKAGIMHKTWFNGSGADAASFMKDTITSAVFMPLSEHRTFPLRTVYPYESSHFPINANITNHALIAPAIVLISYSKNPLFTETIGSLISVQTQEELSNVTQLAPASSRAGAYDKEADDVRFWAAAYRGGPVPDLLNAAFESDTKAAVFAEEIRKYLEK